MQMGVLSIRLFGKFREMLPVFQRMYILYPLPTMIKISTINMVDSSICSMDVLPLSIRLLSIVS